MIHAFETEHARLYGIAGAVIIHNLQFWIARNRANGENLREGRTWTYNSIKAFEKVFDYLTKAQIRHALQKLETAGVILKGNFNELATDQTTWYAFADEETFIGASSHLRKIANGDAKDHTPFAKNRNSLDRTDGNQDGNHTGSPDGDDVSPPLKIQDLMAEAEGLKKQQAFDWLELRKKKGLPLTRTAWDKVKDEAAKAGMTPAQAVVTATENNWGSFRAKWLEAEAGKAGAGSTGPAPAASEWWTTREGIEAKGAELSMSPAEGEIFLSFRIRVCRKAGDGPWRAHILREFARDESMTERLNKAFYPPETEA